MLTSLLSQLALVPGTSTSTGTGAAAAPGTEEGEEELLLLELLRREQPELVQASFSSSSAGSQSEYDWFTPLRRPPSSSSSHQQQQEATYPTLDWLSSSLLSSSVGRPHSIIIEAKQIKRLLKHCSTPEEAADQLLGLLGLEHVELVGELVERRDKVLQEWKGRKEDRKRIKAVGKGKQEPLLLDALAREWAPSSAAAAPQAQAGGRSYTPAAQVVVITAQEKAEQRRAHKAAQRERSALGGPAGGKDSKPIDLEGWERLREEELLRGPGALISGRRAAVEDQEHYPHVYISSSSSSFAPVGLSTGLKRLEEPTHEEIIFPLPRPVPPRTDEQPLQIQSLDIWNRRTFAAYKTLNRLQSAVYPAAYGSNENLLVAAPTGAGKTDVALLAILRCLSTLPGVVLPSSSSSSSSAVPRLPPAKEYKIVYVAPLKALAAEITKKFATRLAWAGVKVRELTGDMRLTKREIEETGVIVTTPEKWDVVTRRSATGGASGGAGREADLPELVRLLIIDEVHLLNEERGAVLEALVARTLRLVESSQRVIRIVGLSATLPNYVDVADFLRVNRHTGLYYFDASFRPIPLEQHFIGVKAKAGSSLSRERLDQVCYEKVRQLVVDEGKQVMVFVHARKETVKTGLMLREKFAEEGLLDALNPEEEDAWPGFKPQLQGSRNREMRDLAQGGVGMHHAGMLRGDRNLSERMFEKQVTKVLCCTATLAWGVNLPAYAVVIKGTQVYDSGKGAFTDLSILDVLQIFGRAGRPQFENKGVGYICTTMDKLQHYVGAITHQVPIESKFIPGLVDSMNAEVALGTVANMDEGVRWLGYSYLYVRLRKNPLVYGLTVEEVLQDPLLGSKRLSLMTGAAKMLKQRGMVAFDEDLGTIESTDMGRIASKYYIRSASIEIFNRDFRPRMSEADVLALCSSSVEFEQIQVRENEVQELKTLMESQAPCQVKGGTDSPAGKVNILLQAYISGAYVDDFALVSDMAYVAQNAGRIMRALLEIAFAKRWGEVAMVLASMSKALEQRMWPYKHPLSQFGVLRDVMYNIERWADEVPINELAAMTDKDCGALIHMNERNGSYVVQAAREFPLLQLSTRVRPLSHDLVQLELELTPTFVWNDKRHGASQSYFLWIEDDHQSQILQYRRIVLRPTATSLTQSFVVNLADVLKQKASLRVQCVSERFVGVESTEDVPLDHVTMPSTPPVPLPLLDLPLLLSTEATRGAAAATAWLAEHRPVFDPIETQAFHSFYYSHANALICTNNPASRLNMVIMAVWRTLERKAGARVLVLCPRPPLARTVAALFRQVFGTSISQLEIKTPFQALGDRSKSYDLVACLDLHSLDVPYELCLSTRVKALRTVVASASLEDHRSVGKWLGIREEDTYAFAPTLRTSPLTTSFQAFTIPHSMALLKAMARVAYGKARQAQGSTILVVPSKAQCRHTIRDLVTLTASDASGASFLDESSADAVYSYAGSVHDTDVAQGLTQGIATVHEDMSHAERGITLDFFRRGAVKVLVVPREACWVLPVRASLVVLLSAQFAAVGREGERELKDYSTAEILHMQALAAAPGGTASFAVLCQTEQAELLGRYAQHGLPLESPLAEKNELAGFVLPQIGGQTTRDELEAGLRKTYLACRVEENPSYYYAEEAPAGDDEEEVPSVKKAPLPALLDDVLAHLEACCLVIPSKDGSALSLSKIGEAVKALPHPARVLAALEQFQSLSVGKLIARLGPDLPQPPSAGAAALGSFLQVLPRSIKDRIGSASNDQDEVLLHAFRAGRVPRLLDQVALAERQAVLVKQLLVGPGPQDGRAHP